MEPTLRDMIQIKDEVHLEHDLKYQSTYYFDIATKCVQAKKDRDLLADQRKVLMAELDQQERATLDKKTEASIAAKVACNPKLVELNMKLADKEAEIGYLQVAREAMDHKRTSLELLSRMQVAGFMNAKSTI